MSMTEIGPNPGKRPGAARRAEGMSWRRAATVQCPRRLEKGLGSLFGVTCHVRQRRVGHEVLMGVERLFALCGVDTTVTAVGQELPALLVVGKVGDHDLIEHLGVYRGVLDRRQGLDATVEVCATSCRPSRYRRSPGATAGRGRCRSRKCGCAPGSGRRSTSRGSSRKDPARPAAGSRCRARRGRFPRQPGSRRRARR